MKSNRETSHRLASRFPHWAGNMSAKGSLPPGRCARIFPAADKLSGQLSIPSVMPPVMSAAVPSGVVAAVVPSEVVAPKMVAKDMMAKVQSK